MSFVQIKYQYGSYEYADSDNLEMDILGCFLTSDVRCMNTNFYKKWALDQAQDVTGGNITSLEKENDFVCLSDLYSEEKVPTKLKMSTKQFVQLLDDWNEKVCKARPQGATITYHDGQFNIETQF